LRQILVGLINQKGLNIRGSLDYDKEEKPKKDIAEELQMRQLEKLGDRWEDCVKMKLREIGWECEDTVHLTQNRNMFKLLLTS